MDFNINKENVEVIDDTSNHKPSQNISEIDSNKPDLTRNIHNFSNKKYKIKLKPKLTHINKTTVPTDDLNLLSNPKKNIDNMDSNSSIDLEDESIEDLNTTNENTLNLDDDEDDGDDDDGDDGDDGDDDDDGEEYEYVDEDDEGEEGEDEAETEYEYEKSYEEIQQEKQELLFKLDRLDKAGYKCSRKYTMASNLEDLKFEYKKLKRQRDVEKSIKFSRKILMAIISGIEFLNGKFDPFDIRLNGWSENMMDNINDYDEVFEELHDKYSESVSVSPELKLIMMVAGSGFMFHLTNSLFKTASPSLNDILKQNPDIMKNISEAAADSIGNNLGPKDDPLANMMRQGMNMKMNNNNKQSTSDNKQTLDDIVNELGNNSSDNESEHNIRKQNINLKSKQRKNNGITIDL